MVEQQEQLYIPTHKKTYQTFENIIMEKGTK